MLLLPPLIVGCAEAEVLMTEPARTVKLIMQEALLLLRAGRENLWLPGWRLFAVLARHMLSLLTGSVGAVLMLLLTAPVGAAVLLLLSVTGGADDTGRVAICDVEPASAADGPGVLGEPVAAASNATGGMEAAQVPAGKAVLKRAAKAAALPAGKKKVAAKATGGKTVPRRAAEAAAQPASVKKEEPVAEAATLVQKATDEDDDDGYSARIGARPAGDSSSDEEGCQSCPVVFFRNGHAMTPRDFWRGRVFGSVGQVRSFYLQQGKGGGSKRQGCCVYRTLEDAQRAIPELDGAEVDGCFLPVWLAVYPPGTEMKQLRRHVRCGLSLVSSPGGPRVTAAAPSPAAHHVGALAGGAQSL